MLDIEFYRMIEKVAKSKLSNPFIIYKHDTKYWESYGHPVRLDNLQQLRLVFDTNQQNRFDRYMDELNGFSENDLLLFVKVLKELIRFQENTFPEKDAILPFDTLIAFFTIYKKILILKPNLKTILEIGAGSGYLSFFLKDVTNLTNYSQIEVSESYYLLQNYINQFVFKNQFEQTLNDSDVLVSPYSPEWPEDVYGGVRIEGEYIKKRDSTQKVCHQYPWWEIGDIVNNNEKFDIITSNANLGELKKEALFDYLSLVNEKLENDGFFFVHCFGQQSYSTFEEIMDVLYKFKLAPLFISNHIFDKSKNRKRLTALNGVFISQYNEMFPKYYQKSNYHKGFISDFNFLQENNNEKKKIYSKNQIAKMVNGEIDTKNDANYIDIKKQINIKDVNLMDLNDKNKINKYKKIAIWGITGERFETYVKPKLKDLNVIALIDNNREMWGTKIENIEVKDPYFLNRTSEIDLIIIVAKSVLNIITQIKGLSGFKNIPIYSL